MSGGSSGAAVSKKLSFNCLKHLKCKVCQNQPAFFYNACGCFYCKDCVHDSCLSDSIELDKETIEVGAEIVRPPFTVNLQSDDCCLHCGAQRQFQFDLSKLRSLNSYLKQLATRVKSTKRVKAAPTGAINYSPVFGFLCSALRIYTLHGQGSTSQQEEEKLMRSLDRALMLFNKIEAAAHKYPYEVAALLACGWTVKQKISKATKVVEIKVASD